MTRADKAPAFTVTVHMSGARKARQSTHTVKAARHYAKGMCGAQSVERITLAGPGIGCELFNLRDAR